VLGSVITEVNSTGQRLRSYVLAGGAVLAKYESSNSLVEWQHANPVTGSQRWTTVNGGFGNYHENTELDPMGVDAGTIDWSQFQGVRQIGSEVVAPRYGDSLNFENGCTDSSAPAACSGDFEEILHDGGSSMFRDVGRDPWYRWRKNLQHDMTFDLGLGTFYGGSLIDLHEQQHTDLLLATLNDYYTRVREGKPWDNPSLAFAPHNPRRLSKWEVGILNRNLGKVLADSECGKFINAMLRSLPTQVVNTVKSENTLLDTFESIKNSGGFWSGDAGSDAGAFTSPKLMKTTLDYTKTTPGITGEGWRQLGTTLILVHELMHIFTKSPNDGSYGHPEMAAAAANAANEVGLNLKSALIEFPNQKNYATTHAYGVALANYQMRVTEYACRKVKL